MMQPSTFISTADHLRGDFSGDIMKSRVDPAKKPASVSGYLMVLFPMDINDVSVAMQVKELTSAKLIVFSWMHLTASKPGTDQWH